MVFGGERYIRLLVSIPLHSGDPVFFRAVWEMIRFVRPEKLTLQSVVKENVFVLGDAGIFQHQKLVRLCKFRLTY